ncbi:MAG: hypothetical protein ABIH89_11190 [Elusimicrobiota bacterium]
MNRLVFIIVLLFFAALAANLQAEDLVEVKYGEYSFHINPFRMEQIEKSEEEIHSVYVNSGIYDFSDRKYAFGKLNELRKNDIRTRLKVMVLPINELVVYISFPDGGNMLVLMGEKIIARDIVSTIEKLLIKKDEAHVMKLMGWKPRVDWLVIPSARNVDLTAIKMLVAEFNVKEIITPSGMDCTFFYNRRHAWTTIEKGAQKKLVADMEIDLLQAESPVKMVSYGTPDFNKHSLMLKLSYIDFSFLFVPDITESEQKSIVEKYGERLRSTILFSSGDYDSINSGFMEAVDPGFVVPEGFKFRFSTGGYLLKVLEDMPIDYDVIDAR